MQVYHGGAARKQHKDKSEEARKRKRAVDRDELQMSEPRASLLRMERDTRRRRLQG